MVRRVAGVEVTPLPSHRSRSGEDSRDKFDPFGSVEPRIPNHGSIGIVRWSIANFLERLVRPCRREAWREWKSRSRSEIYRRSHHSLLRFIPDSSFIQALLNTAQCKLSQNEDCRHRLRSRCYRGHCHPYGLPHLQTCDGCRCTDQHSGSPIRVDP